MKSQLFLIPMLLFTALFFGACDKVEDSGNGKINLSITDAPLDSDGITGVYITVTGVQYNTGGDSWDSFDMDGPETYNLLELTDGTSEMLGSFELEAGTYTQLRFMLDAPEYGSGSQSNPGSYLVFEDGSEEDLFVPSGSQTGYKAVGSFDVPVNGEVDVTADFDARKSVVKAGATGMYILKPTIRLVVNDQAGSVEGVVSNIPQEEEVVIYAYESGEYEETESEDPTDDASRFPNAVTSDMVDELGEYTLSYLAQGTYDLVVVSTTDGEFNAVLGMLEDVEVVSNEVTDAPVDVDELETF